MPLIIEPPQEDETAPLWRRLAWFFGLAGASSAATIAAAYALKALLR